MQVYRLCQAVQGAIPNTHSVLTATVVTSPTRAPSSRIRPTETSKLDAPVNSPTKNISQDKTKANTTSTTLSTLTREPTHTTSTSDGSNVAADTSIPPLTSSSPLQTQTELSTPSKSLSQNQIIGISVGVGASCLFGIGLLLLFLFRQRRRKRSERQKSEGFEIGGIMAEPSPEPFYLGLSRNDRIPGTPVGAYNRSTFEPLTAIPGLRLHSSLRNRDSGPSKAYQDPSQHSDMDEIELESPSSMRTVSRLLPDKPNFELYGRQHPITERLAAVRPASAITIFEEDSDPRRSQSSERQSAAFRTDWGFGSRDSSVGRNPAWDKYSAPSVPSKTRMARRPVGHHTQYYPSSDTMSYQNNVNPTNPLAGLSYALVNGTITSQTSRRNKNEASSPPVRPRTSSIYSSSRSGKSDDVMAGKGDRWPQRSSARHSASSSTTSFETIASDEERVTVKSNRVTKKLSPVEESASRTLSPSNYLQVPARVNYSLSSRGRNEWQFKVANGGNGRSYRRPRPPTEQGQIVATKLGPYHEPIRPPAVVHRNGTVKLSEENPRRFPRPVESRILLSQYPASSPEPQQAFVGVNSDYRNRDCIRPWERNASSQTRGPKLVLNTN
ncbi:hypothetical protein PRK78_002274 [Emydomyces testavorans]|uniref:Uncharacterized protein n=1 Tax=Emydomyces testavorans TaxID=2070801 RepID=A0AAF0IJH6_9EURO|nr:hypothetical protein PRK78_002274 [Emydomyces testavorans]